VACRVQSGVELGLASRAPVSWAMPIASWVTLLVDRVGGLVTAEQSRNGLAVSIAWPGTLNAIGAGPVAQVRNRAQAQSGI